MREWSRGRLDSDALLSDGEGDGGWPGCVLDSRSRSLRSRRCRRCRAMTISMLSIVRSGADASCGSDLTGVVAGGVASRIEAELARERERDRDEVDAVDRV